MHAEKNIIKHHILALQFKKKSKQSTYFKNKKPPLNIKKRLPINSPHAFFYISFFFEKLDKNIMHDFQRNLFV